MRGFITLTISATLLINTTMANDICSPALQSDYALSAFSDIGDLTSSTCGNTEFNEFENKLREKLKIAELRLATKKDQIEYHKSALGGAKAYTTFRYITAGIASGLTTILISRVATPALAMLPVAIAARIQALFIPTVVNDIKVVLVKMAQVGAFTFYPRLKHINSEKEFNSLTSIKFENFDDDVKAFAEANNKIDNLKIEYQKEFSDGGHLSYDDVRYITMQIEADEAKKTLYEKEIEYYKDIYASLYKMCEFN